MGQHLSSCFDEDPLLRSEKHALDRPLTPPPEVLLASSKGTLRQKAAAYDRIERTLGVVDRDGMHGERGAGRGLEDGARGEDLLMRRALDVVAERYIHQPHLSSTWTASPPPRRPQQATPPGTAPKTVFSCRKQAPGGVERGVEAGGGRALMSRFDSAARSESGSANEDAESEDYSEEESEEESARSDAGGFAGGRGAGGQWVPHSSLTGHGARPAAAAHEEPLLTLDEALPETCGVRLRDVILSGSTAPPLELLSLRLTKAQWRRHLDKSGVGDFVSQRVRGDISLTT